MSKIKNIVILGSTGSIGQSALRVIEALPGRFRVIGLGAMTSVNRLVAQAHQFHVPTVAVADPAAAQACRHQSPELAVWSGDEGISRLAALPEADIVLCALVGMSGLRPVLAALEQGTDVALATKEVLVAAGDMVTRLSRRKKARLLPVDSEHSAIFQCLQGQRPETVRRLLLTASGGPFAGRTEIDFDRVTVEEALKHPRWNMGRKVTIDSATLMNKGLEIMEAHWLFGMPLDRIDVVIHPESIVHSMVEFVDGNLLAQLSPPDMRFAIQYALTWPDRLDGNLAPLDLVKAGSLHFTLPDMKRFPCLALARAAAVTGGTMPAVLNAANEMAVARFLKGGMSFSGIGRTVEQVMNRHAVHMSPDLEAIVAADHWARKAAEEEVRKSC